jgi:hypothetical protein
LLIHSYYPHLNALYSLLITRGVTISSLNRSSDNTAIRSYEIVKHNEKKLRLRTNSDKTEYAIYLNTNNQTNNSNNDKLLIATDHSKNIKYTELLDESDYLEDLKYDWKYVLQHWINYINESTIVTTAEPLPESSSSPLSIITRTEKNPIVSQQQTLLKKGFMDSNIQRLRKNGESSSSKIIVEKNLKHKTRKKVKKKRNLKRCHFCKLEFPTNKQRAEHERAWHVHSISK